MTEQTVSKATAPGIAPEMSETQRDEIVMSDLINQARGNLRLAELKAVDLRYWHTAQDCRDILASIEKLILSRKG